jgi:hypothetical protein
MFKDFFTRQVLNYQLKGLPPEQKELIMELVKKHPALFEKIGKEIDEKTKAGTDKTMAALMTMKKYERELRAAATQKGSK